MNLFEKIGIIKSKQEQEIEELAYKKAAKELSERACNEGLKAKAYSHSNGDEKKADAIYIKLRAKQLKKEIRNRRRQEHKNSPAYQEKLKYRNKQDKKAIILVLSVLSVIVFFAIVSV